MNCKTCDISLVLRGKNSFLFAIYCGVFLIRYMSSQCSLNRIVFKAGVQVCFCTMYFCCSGRKCGEKRILILENQQQTLRFGDELR